MTKHHELCSVSLGTLGPCSCKASDPIALYARIAALEAASVRQNEEYRIALQAYLEKQRALEAEKERAVLAERDASQVFAALVVQVGGRVVLSPYELTRKYELERADDHVSLGIVFRARSQGEGEGGT